MVRQIVSILEVQEQSSLGRVENNTSPFKLRPKSTCYSLVTSVSNCDAAARHPVNITWLPHKGQQTVPAGTGHQHRHYYLHYFIIIPALHYLLHPSPKASFLRATFKRCSAPSQHSSLWRAHLLCLHHQEQLHLLLCTQLLRLTQKALSPKGGHCTTSKGTLLWNIKPSIQVHREKQKISTIRQGTSLGCLPISKFLLFYQENASINVALNSQWCPKEDFEKTFYLKTSLLMCHL